MIRILQGTISYPEVKWGKPDDRAANTPLADFLGEIAQVGADGIELWGRHLDGLSSDQVKDLARRIADTGQKVKVLSPYWEFSPSDEAVEQSLADAKRHLELVKIFGAKKIRVFVGAPGSAEATEENWQRAIDGLRRLARMYEGTGVMFVIETHGQQLPDTVESSARLMKELGEPSVMLNYQNMKGDPEAELDVLYQWVEHVHISPVARFADKAEKIVKALLARGYDKTITVEFCADSLPDEGVTFDRAKAVAGMKKDVAFLKSLVK